MAKSEQIKSTDVIQPELFENTIQSAEELNTVLTNLKKNFIEVSKESIKFAQSNKKPQSAQEVKAVNDALEKGNKARLSAVEIAKHQKQLEIEEEKLRQLKLKTEKQLLDAEKKANAEKEKALKQQQKEIDNYNKQNSAYNKASKQLNELRQRYKDMAFEGKGATIEAVNLLKEIRNLDISLKAVDASTGQFNRNVGNYENAIENAIQKTGVFGNVINNITQYVEVFESIMEVKTSIIDIDTTSIEANTTVTNINTVASESNAVAENLETTAHLKNVTAIQAETVATEKLSLAKRVLNAITSPIGAILAIIGAIAGLLTYLNSVNQAVSDFFDKMQSGAKDLLGSGSEFSKLLEMQIKFRKEINGMREDLQKLRDAEGDLNFDYEDQTRTLSFRTKALQDFNKARVDAALKEKEIAQRELDIANQELKAEESRYGVGKGKARQEFYDKQSEAVRRLYDTNDAYLDLITQIIPKSEREFLEQNVINQIELIRSKKLGADTQVEILKKQVDDETTILKNRQNSFIKLTQEQTKAQEEEIKLLKEFGLADKEIRDLIAQKDAVLLEQQLTQLHNDKLSIAQKEELAKVIVEIQKAEFDRGQQQIKLDEQAIKNQERLIQLANQLDEIKRKSAIEDLKETEQRQTKNLENSKTVSLANPFNFGDAKKVMEQIETIKKTQEKLRILEREEINKRYDEQIEAIRKQIKDETKEREIGNAEIAVLTQQKIDELAKVNTAEINLALDTEAFLKELRKKQTIETIHEFNQVTQAFGQELQNRNNLKQQALQQENEIGQRNLERQRQLAEKGLKNTLAFEEQAQAKRDLEAKKQREKQAREQQAVQLTQAFWGAYEAELKVQGATPASAVSKALKDVLLAQGVAKGLVALTGFYEGTESVQRDLQGNKFSNDKDGYIVRVDGSERIMTGEQNAKVGNLTNEELSNLAYNYRTGNLSIPRFELNAIKSNVNETGIKYQSILVQQNNELLTKIDKLIQKPVQSVNVDSFGNLIETIRTEAKQTIITHKPRKRL